MTRPPRRPGNARSRSRRSQHRVDTSRAAGSGRRPPRRRAANGRGHQSLIWLLVIGIFVVAAGWAVSDRITGGGEDSPSEAARPPANPGAGHDQVVARVTIPEGLRREEIAKIIDDETDLSGARYLALTGPSARGRTLAGTSRPTSLEGYLFPATYEITRGMTERQLVDAQIAAYRANTADINFAPAARKNLTEHDVLTIASMIEREVAEPTERPLVASVIENRLRADMSLGIDATVQYALGDWRPELTNADLDINSPYNTRKFKGLPPGPISNPGRDAIQAAARPKATDYLYYVARFDGTGRHYFSTNAEQFEIDVQRSRANAAQ